jgi:hypothetical protein
MPRFLAYGIIARSAQLGVGALGERPDREPLSPGDLFARLGVLVLVALGFGLAAQIFVSVTLG